MPASLTLAVFLGRCSHSCSWWPFSWPPGQRQVSDHPHPTGPPPSPRWHRGPSHSACPWSSYPPAGNILHTSFHPTSYQGVWCWINHQQEQQSKACSQEEPVGTSPSSSPTFSIWKVELSQKWWQMVANWRKENTKLPLKRAEWVWPLLLVPSASAWQTCASVFAQSPGPTGLLPNLASLPRPSGAPLFQGWSQCLVDLNCSASQRPTRTGPTNSPHPEAHCEQGGCRRIMVTANKRSLGVYHQSGPGKEAMVTSRSLLWSPVPWKTGLSWIK